MKKIRIMGIFAHPDDETFGPGATLAKYASLGHDVYVVCATRGQVGQSSDHVITKELGFHRERELRKATQILGLKEVIVLDFYDGSLNEQQLPVLKRSIEHEIHKVNPDVVIVYEREGISWHLDHIAVVKAVTQLYDEGRIKPKKLYYFGLDKKVMEIFGLEGCLNESKLAKIDIKKYWQTKVKAMKAHKSQEKDYGRLLARLNQIRQDGHSFWHYDNFQLARTRLKGLKFPETDLLDGL